MREESARRLWFLSTPSVEQRDDSLREEIGMNADDCHEDACDDYDYDHHQDEDEDYDHHDAIPSHGFVGKKLKMMTPKGPYQSQSATTLTTPMTVAVTPMTPSPIHSPFHEYDHDHYLFESVSVSPNPGIAPTTAPTPRNSYHGNSNGNALSDLQQGYLADSKLFSPEAQVQSRALFRDAITPDFSRSLHDGVSVDVDVDVHESSVVVPPSTIQKSRRRASRLSQSLLLDAPMMPMATPFGMSERRRTSNTKGRVSPNNTSPENSLHCSPDTSPRTAAAHQRSTSRTSFLRSSSSITNLVDTEKRYSTIPIRPTRRNFLAWTLGLVALSSVCMVLMVSWSLLEKSSSEPPMYHPSVRPDLRYSDAGLRGKMVQIAGQHKDPHNNNNNNKKKQQQKVAEHSSLLTSTTTTTKTDKHKKEAPKQPPPPPHETHKATAPKAVADRTPSQTILHVVHMPPKISTPPNRKFDNQDPSMYVRGGKPKSKTKFSRRVVSLDESFGQTLPHHRRIKPYPADFTDNTQLYSILSSSDERLNKMEQREPYSNGECVPMQDWQTNFYPVCNGIHEIGMESTLGEPNGEDVHLFGTKGYWRNAWRLDLLGGSNSKANDRDTVVLKTLK